MVVSSRSTRGRSSVRNEPNSSPSSNISHPVNFNNDTHDHDASAVQQDHQHEDAGSSRAKRSRLTSISDRDSLQKRRRLSKGNEAGPAQVHIPLRGRTVQDTYGQKHVAARGPALPPPLVTRDSDVSNNSPLDSPNYRPTYDQFKRIEEKAQKVVKKHSAKDEKRKLRSEHGSTRSKTELAQYFPNFDDLLSLEPEDPEILTAKTRVELINDTPSFEPPPSESDFFRNLQPPHNSQVIDLDKYIKVDQNGNDPLAESVYSKAHQKAERHEKQIKNGDKERAQHEKYQLERLLEELRGPDWLKTLGISGITDTEKKRYEVKRNLFIRETKTLINKFKRWKEEEKRRKIEKQQQLLEEVETEHDDKASSSTITKVKARSRIRHGTNSRNRSQANSRATSVVANRTLDSNDIDALASQQLLEEAKKVTTSRPKAGSISLPLLPEIQTRPFVSFFAKRHIRDAAVLGRNRGRKIYAFGHEIPDWEEEEFELPESILTEDAIKASQRSRRRKMRSTDDSH